MFTNYSQTYAAAIATYVPIIVLILGKFGVSIAESELTMIVSSIIASVGFIWQIVHRWSKGGVSILGKKS